MHGHSEEVVSFPKGAAFRDGQFEVFEGSTAGPILKQLSLDGRVTRRQFAAPDPGGGEPFNLERAILRTSAWELVYWRHATRGGPPELLIGGAEGPLGVCARASGGHRPGLSFLLPRAM
jgi:hypothetical protein